MEGGDVVQEPEDEVIPPTFDLQLGFALINRSLAYQDDRSTPVGLRPYSLPLGPAVVAHVIWFPLGPFTDGAAKNIGVEGHIEQAFFISSTLAPDSTPGAPFPNGAKFSTAVHEYSGGVRYRMTFGAGNYFFGSLTGGEHAFTFHSTSTDPTMQRANLDIPDTIYRFMPPGHRIALRAGRRHLGGDRRRLPLGVQQGRPVPRRVLPDVVRERRRRARSRSATASRRCSRCARSSTGAGTSRR